MNGRLIGINRMIVSPSGGSSGIGFAIPSNLVRIVADAAAQRRARRSGPGSAPSCRPVTPEIADGLGLDAPGGVLVADVDPIGPGGDAPGSRRAT